jgi:hypothetical protein
MWLTKKKKSFVTSHQMSEIADLTYNVVAFSEIMQVMTWRLFSPVARLESLTLLWWGTWSTTVLLPQAIFSDLRILTISIPANGRYDETFHWSLPFLVETPLSQKCSGCNYYRKKFCKYCPQLWFLHKIWNCIGQSWQNKLARAYQPIGLYHPLDGVTNPKFTLLCFLATNFLEREEGTSLQLG